MSDSFAKRQRERKKMQKKREKAARKQDRVDNPGEAPAGGSIEVLGSGCETGEGRGHRAATYAGTRSVPRPRTRRAIGTADPGRRTQPGTRRFIRANPVLSDPTSEELGSTAGGGSNPFSA